MVLALCSTNLSDESIIVYFVIGSVTVVGVLYFFFESSELFAPLQVTLNITGFRKKRGTLKKWEKTTSTKSIKVQNE